MNNLGTSGDGDECFDFGARVTLFDTKQRKGGDWGSLAVQVNGYLQKMRLSIPSGTILLKCGRIAELKMSKLFVGFTKDS